MNKLKLFHIHSSDLKVWNNKIVKLEKIQKIHDLDIQGFFKKKFKRVYM